MTENQFTYSPAYCWQLLDEGERHGFEIDELEGKISDIILRRFSKDKNSELEALVEKLLTEFRMRSLPIPEEYDAEKAEAKRKNHHGEAEKQELEWAATAMFKAVDWVLVQDQLNPRTDFPNYPGVRAGPSAGATFEEGTERKIERYRKAVDAWEKRLQGWGF